MRKNCRKSGHILAVALLLGGGFVNTMVATTQTLSDAVYMSGDSRDKNLCASKHVEYSGVEGGKTGDTWKYPQFVGEMAVDGNEETRWSADKVDEQWLIVDLEEEQPLAEIKVNFSAESPEWTLEISQDKENWDEVYSLMDGKSGQITEIVTIVLPEIQQARYIRYMQKKMWKHTNNQYYGSSIFELSAFGQRNVTIPESISIVPRDFVLVKGSTKMLSVNVLAEEAWYDEKNLTFESSDEHVVKVNENGVVQGVKRGVAMIKCTLEGTGLTDEIKVTVQDADSVYQEMQTRWFQRLVGTENSDAQRQEYNKLAIKKGADLWQSLHKSSDEPTRTTLWDKISTDTVSANITTQYTKLKQLALAYATKDSLLHTDEVYAELISALHFMIDVNEFGSSTSGNWWDWQIGAPQQLIDTLMVLYDDMVEKNPEDLTKSVDAVYHYCYDPAVRFNGYTNTGANLTDVAISVLGIGILRQDSSLLELVQSEVPSVADWVTSGDGLYKDGSLVQHTKVAYNGAYGNELLKGIARIQAIVCDYQWEISDSRMNNLFTVVDKGFLQLMVHGQMSSAFCGRSISRPPGLNPFSTELESGKETIANLLMIAKFAPDNLQQKIYSTLKQWVLEVGNAFDFTKNVRDYEALDDLLKLMNDERIQPYEVKGIANVYGSMDRAFQKKEGYSVAISAYSSRIYSYEGGTGAGSENKNGWHTGDGMLYLYNNDYNQFAEGYWPTVDPYRLPGTTVDTRGLAENADQSEANSQTWVGGSTDGKLIAYGMQLDKNHASDMDLQAKKSYFLLENEVVCLGTDISGTTDATIEQIVENRKLSKNATYHQGTQGDKTWVNIQNTDGNLGYVIKNNAGAPLNVYEETRSGKYSDINGTFPNDTEYTNRYLKILQNFGSSVSKQSYEYAIVPNKDDLTIAKNAMLPGYQVVANNEKVQAIYSDGIWLSNVWAQGEKIGHLTFSTTASAIVKEISPTQLSITLSDPTQKLSNVSVALDLENVLVESKENNIAYNDGVVTLATTGLAGSSQTIVLNHDAAIDPTQVSAKDTTLVVGDSWKAGDNFVSATDKTGAVISDVSKVSVDSNLDLSEAGVYWVVYSIKNAMNLEVTAVATITVLKEDASEIKVNTTSKKVKIPKGQKSYVWQYDLFAPKLFGRDGQEIKDVKLYATITNSLGQVIAKDLSQNGKYTLSTGTYKVVFSNRDTTAFLASRGLRAVPPVKEITSKPITLEIQEDTGNAGNASLPQTENALPSTNEIKQWGAVIVGFLVVMSSFVLLIFQKKRD